MRSDTSASTFNSFKFILKSCWFDSTSLGIFLRNVIEHLYDNFKLYSSIYTHNTQDRCFKRIQRKEFSELLVINTRAIPHICSQFCPCQFAAAHLELHIQPCMLQRQKATELPNHVWPRRHYWTAYYRAFVENGEVWENSHQWLCLRSLLLMVCATVKLFVRCLKDMSMVQSCVCLYLIVSRFVPKAWSNAEAALQKCAVRLVYGRSKFLLCIPFWKLLHFPIGSRKCLLAVVLLRKWWKDFGNVCHKLEKDKTIKLSVSHQFCQTEFIVFKLALCCTNGLLLDILFKENLFLIRGFSSKLLKRIVHLKNK